MAVPTGEPRQVDRDKAGAAKNSGEHQEVVQKHPERLFKVQIRMLLADRRKQECVGVGSGGDRAGM